MEMLLRMNWVDLLALILVLRTSYVALNDGLSHEIFPLIGSVCMFVFSLHYYVKLALFFHENGIPLPVDILNLISFALVGFLIGILFRFIKVIVDKILTVSWNPLIEKFGGLLAGILRGAILASTVLVIISLIPLPYLQHSIRERSLTGAYFMKIGPAINDRVSGVLPELGKVKK